MGGKRGKGRARGRARLDGRCDDGVSVGGIITSNSNQNPIYLFSLTHTRTPQNGYQPPPSYSNHAHLPLTLPSSSAANLPNTPGLRSTSSALHPVQRSTTTTSTLFSRPSRSSTLTILILRPHSGFSFGFPDTAAASYSRCETAATSSPAPLSTPHAPKPGPGL